MKTQGLINLENLVGKEVFLFFYSDVFPEVETMKSLLITIHLPSCKSNNILSDDFANALRKEFEFDQYNLKFSFSASDPDGYSDDGVITSLIKTENPTEIALVQEKIKATFRRLVDLKSKA